MPPCPPVYSLYPRAPVSSTAMSHFHLVSDDPLHLQFLQRSVWGILPVREGRREGVVSEGRKATHLGKRKSISCFAALLFKLKQLLYFLRFKTKIEIMC